MVFHSWEAQRSISESLLRSNFDGAWILILSGGGGLCHLHLRMWKMSGSSLRFLSDSRIFFWRIWGNMHKSIIVNLFKSVVNLRNQKKWQLSNFFGREEMHKSIYSKSVTSVVNLRNQKKMVVTMGWFCSTFTHWKMVVFTVGAPLWAPWNWRISGRPSGPGGFHFGCFVSSLVAPSNL